ncbi:MAG: septal ring lytic transglycosylase RlpA family protein [Alphaproteobacteria bacterium]|nr:MAG: septal ring lytic transglycosylase RlpA family protein [Alphaproteobacteria bacterium]
MGMLVFAAFLSGCATQRVATAPAGSGLAPPPATAPRTASLPLLPIPDEWLRPPATIGADADAAVSGQGMASWYGGRFQNRRKANGERFNRHEFTTAHRTLPFGTYLRVTNLETGQSVFVKVTDRGPYRGNRVLDVSQAAARELGMLRSGVALVQYDIVPEAIALQGRIEVAPATPARASNPSATPQRQAVQRPASQRSAAPPAASARSSSQRAAPVTSARSQSAAPASAQRATSTPARPPRRT